MTHAILRNRNFKLSILSGNVFRLISRYKKMQRDPISMRETLIEKEPGTRLKLKYLFFNQDIDSSACNSRLGF